MKFLNARKGSIGIEVIMFASLAFTLVFAALFIHRAYITEAAQERTLIMLDSRMTAKCLNRTRANDTVSAFHARNYNCFRLEGGSDRITVDQGDNIIYPGMGNDMVTVAPGAQETQIVYEGGDDVYRIETTGAVIDLRGIPRNAAALRITQQTAFTRKPGAPAPADGEGAPVDLSISTKAGTITVAGHLLNPRLEAVAFKDLILWTSQLVPEAIKDAGNPMDNTIFGSPGNDIIRPGGGQDVVFSQDGDDIIIYESGDDIYDPGIGADILDLSIVSSQEVSFSALEGGQNVRIEIPQIGSIVMLDQAVAEPRAPGMKFMQVQFNDTILTDAQIRMRAILDQASDNADVIYGTAHTDIFRPGTGSNSLFPYAGNDIIHHEGGRDVIFPPEDISGASYTIDISFLEMRLIDFEIGEDDKDMMIRTGDSSFVLLKGVNANPSILSAIQAADGRISALEALQYTLRPDLPRN